MQDRKKVIEDLTMLREHYDAFYESELRTLDDALALLKEQQQQIWELQDQVEYLTDKRKEQETKLICNLLGGQPYEVYCRECRMILCILGKGETMNDVKSIFSYCPHCGRQVKWE